MEDLIGISVIYENTILLLCVDEDYRCHKIGSHLLKESEEMIARKGYKNVKVGVAFDYLMPGVPTSKRYTESVNEDLYDAVDDHASRFFENRGYIHGQDCNIFDMRFALTEFCREEYSIGDTIDGIIYRFATINDREAVWKCTDDALKEFTQWYRSEELYTSERLPKVLIATHMVTLGTKYLRDLGLREAYLSYTYSGLERMYGYAGYKICVYFMMAEKKL